MDNLTYGGYSIDSAKSIKGSVSLTGWTSTTESHVLILSPGRAGGVMADPAVCIAMLAHSKLRVLAFFSNHVAMADFNSFLRKTL